MPDHHQWMERALDLAKRALGRTSPNPVVGAVIVRNQRVIGEGWHRQAGEPHAEIEALRSAQEPVDGATMYVTLEPCCHHGRTPPCSQALIEAGIGRVFYAVADPNPRVAGGGHKQLVEAGIEVQLGPLTTACRQINRHFFHFITTGRPYVTAKFAMSLDGKIATRTGASQWITGPEARLEGHRLRDLSDAILIGTGTAIADNPRLTTRLPGESVQHPLRIVLDRQGRIPIDARLFQSDLPGDTLLVTGPELSTSRRRLLQNRGVRIWQQDTNQDGSFDLGLLLDRMGQESIVSLMVEGGQQLLGQLRDTDLIDEIWSFVGGKLIGGQQAPGPMGASGCDGLLETQKLRFLSTEVVGSDLLIKAQVDRSQTIN